MLKSITKVSALVILISLVFACGSQEKGVYFVNLNDGDTVTSPFKVEMGVNGMEVEPAGKVNEGFGHHHLIIDGSFIEAGVTVPANETNIHYGKGQKTTDDIVLSPGQHTLTLQFADGVHASYGEAMSKTITITVE
ncbi:DUF4399 domain-containing protein [Algoriphagus namhaensis]|uniref:DUF4399 domain-containing protein n=1 Tax=Algoriphagus namhaensis TaxID=915353 RepID=A0ABV8AUH1_9BACT